MMLLFEGDQAPQKTIQFIEEKGCAGLWSWDIAARKHEWSPGLYALLGLDPIHSEPSYELFAAHIHPDDRRPPGQIEHIVSQALPVDRTFRIIRPDGRQRWILSRGEILVDAAGKPTRAVGIFFDVTHHHERLEALRLSEDRFNVLVKTLHAAIWTASSDGSISSSFNWGELLGESTEKVMGFGWLDYMHPDDRDASLEAWKTAAATRSPYEVEHRAKAADGTYHWFKSRAMPVLNSDGTVREWLGISVDINESRTWPTEATLDEPLTGAQIRAARGILNWSVRDLAETSRVSPSTIRRLEESSDSPEGREPSLEPIRKALEAGGVEFLFPPSGKPGLRPR